MHVVIVAACSAGGGALSEPSDTDGFAGSSGSGSLPDGGIGEGSPSVSGGSPPSSEGTPSADSGSPSFVPIAEVHAAESGSRLKAKWLVAEDGSRHFTFQWFDSERGHDCGFRVAADGIERCLPAAAPASVYYRNASCTLPVFAFARESDCGTGSYGIVAELASCGVYRARVFPIGAIIDPNVVYIRSGTQCVQSTVSESLVYRAAGAEITATSFVAGSYQIDP